MTRDRSLTIRIIVQFALAALFLAVAVVTVIEPEWIEVVFGIDPDRGSGALEWVIVLALGVLAVVAAGFGARTVIRRRRIGHA
ncbi:hypothetical protein CVS47_02053 [Microbacterium lemovicicum]|uniref:Uncharacterized protein n=1 Tax=Microbacterium lemovicicum TaxID=1072463 RepID=A0A3Q9J0N6_9MICO|nr:ABC transporter permease [Microbacterium lemovicicum]AZS37417.1 hypothetical protein CVS47_02053 [Microbacterium lemovicicum]